VHARLTAALATLALAASGALASGCTDELHTLDWGFEFATPELRMRARVVEARLALGGCTSGREVFHTAIAVDGTASMSTSRPDVLSPGLFGLTGSAIDDTCTVFAEGCLEVELPAGADMRHVVTLDAIGAVLERTLCVPEECTGGECTPFDAALPDAGPQDAGTDAGTDAGPDFDAGPPQPDAGFDAGPPLPDAGPPVDAGPSRCPPGLADCDMNGSCETNTTSDPLNCGLCARSCGFAMCVASTCSCSGSLVFDGFRCVDTTADPLHCGSLTTRCRSDQTCVSSVCACRPGLETLAGGACTDLQTDPNNCGVAGHSCAAMACSGGTCVTSCPMSATNCSGACVVVASDPRNCGACGRACGPESVCTAGICQDYRPASGCSSCPCSSCTGETRTCCAYGIATICSESSTCPTVMP